MCGSGRQDRSAGIGKRGRGRNDREVENIIAAGRCIAHDGIAVMATCYGTGEAAGAAAALSIKEDVPFRKLSVKKLQDQLKKQGVYLGDQEPEKPEPRYIHISTI